MTAVDLAEAKARLSELVERAAAGEVVRILRRGMPVAQIIAIETRPEPISLACLESVTARMPKQREGARKWLCRLRDEARY